MDWEAAAIVHVRPVDAPDVGGYFIPGLTHLLDGAGHSRRRRGRDSGHNGVRLAVGSRAGLVVLIIAGGVRGGRSTEREPCLARGASTVTTGGSELSRRRAELFGRDDMRSWRFVCRWLRPSVRGLCAALTAWLFVR